MEGNTYLLRGRTRRAMLCGARQLAAALCTLAALCLPVALAAQQVSVTTGVDVLDDSRVTNTGDLDFGKVLPGPGGGSISVAPDGDVAVAGGLVAIGATSPASFNLTRDIGVDYLTYQAPLISDTIEIAHADDPSITMTVRNFTTDFNRTITLFGLFTLPAYYFQTSYDFRVGGTLDVDANQLAGEYSGTFTVIIDYE